MSSWPGSAMRSERLIQLTQFYALMDCLGAVVGGARLLADLGQRREWPQRGVYFFFDPDEPRTDSGEGHRVVRVGTHALTASSRSTLHQRLSQHRGQASGRGNHRGSIFRLLVGQALQSRGDFGNLPSWGLKSSIGSASAALGLGRLQISEAEEALERGVTHYLARLEVLWLEVDDEPGAHSIRGVVEQGAIALLSNLERDPLDPPSSTWLGRHSDRRLVRGSGLWNQRHVGEMPDRSFLDILEGLIGKLR